MLNRNPETYNEIVHLKKMLDLAKYYNISTEVLDEISDFVLENKKNSVVCDLNKIVLKNAKGEEHKVYKASKLSSSIDGLTLTSASLVVIPHYTPSSSGGGYSGGGSSNNNNNNNNNNSNNNNNNN